MSNESALQAATNEHVAADEALSKFFRDNPNGASLPEGKALLDRDKAARKNYAAQLRAAGHAVPHGLEGKKYS